MKFANDYNLNRIFLAIEFILLVACLFQDNYGLLVLLLLCVSVMRFLSKVGNGSFYLELIYLYTVFTCLLMPSIGYTYFSRENDLARLWGRYMPISAEKYFSFNLPAVIFLGFSFFTFRSGYRDDAIVIDRLVERINESVVKINPTAIIILTSASLFAYGVSGALPAALSQVNTFLYFSLFAGAFYIVFYKGFPYRWYFIGGIVFFVLWDAVKHSMFTIIAYMGGLFMILLLAGRRVTAGQKIIMLIIAVVFMGFVQLFKLDLRRSRIMGYDPGVYEVATRVIASSRKAGPEDLLFPMYYRMNQGFNIALVQRRIPERVDYLGGSYLAISFI